MYSTVDKFNLRGLLSKSVDLKFRGRGLGYLPTTGNWHYHVRL